MLLARWPLRVCTDVYIYTYVDVDVDVDVDVNVYVYVYVYVYTNLFACIYISICYMLLRAPLHVGREARRKRAGSSLM